MPAAREGRDRRLEPGEFERLTEALAIEKIVVVAPIPIASESAAVTLNPGLCHSRRVPCRTSCSTA
jgi:hypothetical protein